MSNRFSLIVPYEPYLACVSTGLEGLYPYTVVVWRFFFLSAGLRVHSQLSCGLR